MPEFINHNYIENLLKEAKNTDSSEITGILDKAERFEGLTHSEVAALLASEDKSHLDRMSFHWINISYFISIAQWIILHDVVPHLGLVTII